MKVTVTHICPLLSSHTYPPPRTHTQIHNTYTYTNTAVFFEQGEWDKCLETCEEAVEKGREVRADFKLIAK